MDFRSKKGILVAYGELFLKSEGVREIFKKRLFHNIFLFLKKANLDFKIFPFHDRIFIEMEETKKAQKIIKKVFGLSWFAECLFFENTNLKVFSDFVANNYQGWIKKNESFAIRLKKVGISSVEHLESREKMAMRTSFSSLPSSRQSRDLVIDEIAKKIKRKVDLTKPDREIFIEVKKAGWFFYFKKNKGSGGLPSGSQGKVLSLVSGGIDSPVASFLTAKRGVEDVWLHFHSFPLVSKASIEKVKELARVFLNFQPRLKIYFIPFADAQMKIKTETPAKFRILLYRRMMLKIAEIIAEKENCEALVTGESLGQVSSQTLPNLRIIEEGIKLPVFRPLIFMDKEEIIGLAKKIKTFTISIKPQEDCCTLFTPKHPTARGNIETIKKLEGGLKIKEIIKETLKRMEVEEINSLLLPLSAGG